MSGHGEKFTRKQELAVAALMLHGTISEAASACGIAGSTLRRWMKDDDFAALYESHKDRAASTATRLLRQHAVQAVMILVGVMKDEEAGHGARISAARTVLEMTLRPRAEKSGSLERPPSNDLELRIEELEKVFKAPLVLMRSDGSTRRLNSVEAFQEIPQLTADAE